MGIRIAIIGRSALLFNTMAQLHQRGYTIPLVISAKEAPEYRYTSNDFKKFAETIGAYFIHNPRIKKSDLVEIKDVIGSVDLGVSINYSGVISQEVIDFFRMGILNVHGGDLPRYRGNACQAWALLNGEERIGLCVHKMIGGELDSGDIVARKYYPVSIDSRIGQIMELFENDIPDLMLQAIESLEADGNSILESQSKDPADSLRCYPRMPEDGRIDWRKSAIEIVRLINASSEPFAGAFAWLNEHEVRIWRASLLNDNEKFLAVPGQVCRIHTDGSMAVATGDGKVCVESVSLAGKPEWIRPSELTSSIRSRFK